MSDLPSTSVLQSTEQNIPTRVEQKGKVRSPVIRTCGRQEHRPTDFFPLPRRTCFLCREQGHRLRQCQHWSTFPQIQAVVHQRKLGTACKEWWRHWLKADLPTAAFSDFWAEYGDTYLELSRSPSFPDRGDGGAISGIQGGSLPKPPRRRSRPVPRSRRGKPSGGEYSGGSNQVSTSPALQENPTSVRCDRTERIFNRDRTLEVIDRWRHRTEPGWRETEETTSISPSTETWDGGPLPVRYPKNRREELELQQLDRSGRHTVQGSESTHFFRQYRSTDQVDSLMY